MTQYCLVPQAALDEIEEARQELYAMFPDIDTTTLCKLQKISDPMWRIAHTQWEKIKGDT